MNWLADRRTDSKDAAIRRKAVRAFLAVLICLVIILGAVGAFIGAFAVERQKRAATLQELIRQIELAIKDFESDHRSLPDRSFPEGLGDSEFLSFWLCNDFSGMKGFPLEDGRFLIRGGTHRGPYLERGEIGRFATLGEARPITIFGQNYEVFTIHDKYGREITFEMLSISGGNEDAPPVEGEGQFNEADK